MIWILLAARAGGGPSNDIVNASAAKIAVRRVVKLRLCIFLFSLSAEN
jgi:hypothetical protein